MVAQGDGCCSKEGPKEADGTPWGVLVRSTNGGEPETEAGKGPPRGRPDITGTSARPASDGRAEADEEPP